MPKSSIESAEKKFHEAHVGTGRVLGGPLLAIGEGALTPTTIPGIERRSIEEGLQLIKEDPSRMFEQIKEESMYFPDSAVTQKGISRKLVLAIEVYGEKLELVGYSEDYLRFTPREQRIDEYHQAQRIYNQNPLKPSA